MAGSGSVQRRAEEKAVLRGIKRLAERLKKAFPQYLMTLIMPGSV